MIVISLTNCPPALRGDLTKWLQEINTGVYVGHISARVRDTLWKRVKENTKSGSATMVYSTNNEQHMDFRVHNTIWEPINFDGLKLMLRPSPARIKRLSELRMGFSKASKIRMAKQISGRKRQNKPLPQSYAVIDIETTGLSVMKDELISISALLICDGGIKGEYHSLINVKARNHAQSDSTVGEERRDVALVLPEFLEFLGDAPVVTHNADFIFGFLRFACKRCGLPLFSNKCVDTMQLARRLLDDDVKNYKIETLLEHFQIETNNPLDCETSKMLYCKLNDLQQELK